MTRLDEQSSDPWLREKSQQEKLKKEIRDEVIMEMKRKKHRKVLTCCVLELATVALILGLATTAIAKTGLIQIPLFSKIFYKTPAPQRVVTVTPEEMATFETDIIQKLKKQVEPKIQPGVTGQKIEVNLEFTEKELTTFLKTLETSEQIPLKNSQISVTDEAIEIFGEIEEPQKIYLTLAVEPEVQDSELNITLTKIKLGNLSLPPSWGNFLVDKFLSNRLQSMQEAIGKAGKLESITLLDGKVVLQGLVDVLIFTQEME